MSSYPVSYTHLDVYKRQDHSVVSGLFDGNGSIGVGGYFATELYHIKGYDKGLWNQTIRCV